MEVMDTVKYEANGRLLQEINAQMEEKQIQEGQKQSRGLAEFDVKKKTS